MRAILDIRSRVVLTVCLVGFTLLGGLVSGCGSRQTDEDAERKLPHKSEATQLTYAREVWRKDLLPTVRGMRAIPEETPPEETPPEVTACESLDEARRDVKVSALYGRIVGPAKGMHLVREIGVVLKSRGYDLVSVPREDASNTRVWRSPRGYEVELLNVAQSRAVSIKIESPCFYSDRASGQG